MQAKTQKAIVIDSYGSKPYLKEDQPIPTPSEGQLLIKVAASTINPADRLFIEGKYFRRPLPAVCGMEGTGTVVEAKGEALQSWVGKRVTFISSLGSWAEYAVANPLTTFQIEKDVPLSSASSGAVNPLTVLGFIENFKHLGGKGIIHTPAASSLGRMLIKLCKKDNIPLLNIVRRKEQAELLKKEGATHIIVTEGEWEKELKEHIQKEGFNVVYDALGGGPITEIIINNLPPKGTHHIFGSLEQKPVTISNTSSLISGVRVTGYNLYGWWMPSDEQTKHRVRSHYSALLKNELSTHTYKEVHLKDINEGIELSISKANEGKILIKIE